MVQLASYGIDLGTYLLISSLFEISHLVANLFGKIAAGLVAFVLHRYFTFRIESTKGIHRQAIKYFTLLAANIPVNSAVFFGTLHLLADATQAKILADVICVGATFLLTERVVFHRQAARNP